MILAGNLSFHFIAAHQRDHLGASAGQDIAFELQHRFFVLYQQNATLDHGLSRRSGNVIAGAPARSLAGRRTSMTAPPFATLRAEMSPPCSFTAIADAEAKASPFAYTLRSVEGVEMRFGSLIPGPES